MAPLALGVGWLLGSYAASWLALSLEIALAAAALLLVGALLGRKHPVLPLVLLFFAASCGGYARAVAAAPSHSILASLYGLRVEARGTVVDAPERRGATDTFRLSIEELRVEGDQWRTVGADVLVRAEPFYDIHYGDVLVVRGRLDEPWQPDRHN